MSERWPAAGSGTPKAADLSAREERKEEHPSLSLLPSPGRAAAEPGARPDAGQVTAPGGLDARYEHLRHAALHARAQAFPLGFGVLAGKGVTAWQRALASLTVPQPAPPAPLAAVPGQAGRLPAPVAAELISALAAVALAGTDHPSHPHRPEETPVMLPDLAASKVTAAHLSRQAVLYIRQSSLKQVIHNTESAIRQYDLRGKAIALGWDASQITVIDIDQGQSGASAADREGFQQMVAEVSLGRAGIVLGLECSRLARNNADWHQLLELCGLTGTLICDEDGLYDPRSFNDRLVLGMKGQISEAELHFLRARLRGGIISKARRGELIMPLPVGLVYDPAGHVILDPDTAIQGAVRHLLSTFEATGSATAVVKAFRAAGLTFPLAAPQRTPQGRGRLAAAAPPCRAAGPAQPPLRRRVHLRPAPRATAARQETGQQHHSAPRGMDLLHPRRPSRIHHPGPVGGQPRQARGQRRRARPRPGRRAAPRGPRPAAGHHHLRPLRRADDHPLPRPRRERPAHLPLPA